LRLIRGDDASSSSPRLRLVTANPRTSRYALVLLLIAAIGVFGVVSVGAKTAEAAVEVRALEQDVDELKRDYELLTAEVAELESPDRIRSVAVERLGMVEPDESTFVVVDGQGRFALRDPDDGSVDDGFTDKVKQVLATQP
ncbi:MAG TPA: cell division protein FtsL, partial [Euzebyales bacterium]|nr:cell division protein FtsL [Euzebyales bacterium]